MRPSEEETRAGADKDKPGRKLSTRAEVKASAAVKVGSGTAGSDRKVLVTV